MAEPNSKRKDRITEIVILAFVVISVGLLIVQLAMNVSDTREQTDVNGNDSIITPMPSEPAPTFEVTVPPIGDA